MAATGATEGLSLDAAHRGQYSWLFSREHEWEPSVLKDSRPGRLLVEPHTLG